MNEKVFVPFVSVNEDEKNSMTTAVKGILLSKCVEIFASFDKEREKKHGDRPPVDATIYYKQKEDPQQPAKTVQMWHLEKGILTELKVPDCGYDHVREKTEAMYYRHASFDIIIDYENSSARLYMHMGPLFGRGFIVDIGRSGDTPYLGKYKILWIA